VGQTPEEIEREIESTRDALGAKVDALSGQVKEGVEVARSRGVKVVGAIFAIVTAILAAKKLRRR